MEKKPFFVIGCVRSGTTFLRDVLRRHPHLASPEETHFYRWGEPFGSPRLTSILLDNQVLKKHRELDGISEHDFANMLKSSVSRADLYRRYMSRYIAVNKPEAVRWFDKTPQNVYGAAMIAAEFPGSKFVHIVRHPIDVISSLKIGKVVKVENIVGACNYWNEAAKIIHVIKRAYPKRVYELRYEEFTANFLPELEKLLIFLGEEFNAEYFNGIEIEAKTYDYQSLFTDKELMTIRKLCGHWAERYGYSFSGD